MTETPPGPPEGRQPPTPTEPPPEGSQGIQEPAAPEAEPTNDVARLRRESARYRTERNEVREERDRLRDTVAAYQRSAAEAIARERLEDASDLWRDGLDLGELLAEDGTVDGDRVVEAVERVVEAHPGWAKGRRVPDPDFAAGVRGQAANGPPSFGEALKGQLGQQSR